jgi:hypothetical protein
MDDMSQLPPSKKYAEVRSKIRSGDLLSFHPCFAWYNPFTYLSVLIGLTNKNRISHSAMACWIGKSLCCLQMDSTSMRIVPLSLYADAYPGKIVVSRALVPRGFRRDKATSRMLEIVETQYGWARVAILAFSRTITGGKWYPVDKNDKAKSPWPKVCSEAYSCAMRRSGFDPCPDRADHRTEPHHLYESPQCRPMFTLI